jgi:hypothetical protein
VLVVVAVGVNLVLTRVERALIRCTAEWLQILIGVAVESIALSFAALSTAILFFDLLAPSPSRLRPPPTRFS